MDMGKHSRKKAKGSGSHPRVTQAGTAKPVGSAAARSLSADRRASASVEARPASAVGALPSGEPGSLVRPDRTTKVFFWFLAFAAVGYVLNPEVVFPFKPRLLTELSLQVTPGGELDLVSGVKKKLLGDF